MLKLSHTSLIVISGLIWLAIGLWLLPLGLNLLVESILQANIHTMKRPLLDTLGVFFGGVESALLVVVAICLVIGYGKGRYVFGKTVKKSVERIQSLPNPTSLGNIYTKKYYILLGSMVFIGMLARMTPNDIRGAIDVTIGSALINGSLLYFYSAFQSYRRENDTV